MSLSRTTFGFYCITVYAFQSFQCQTKMFQVFFHSLVELDQKRASHSLTSQFHCVGNVGIDKVSQRQVQFLLIMEFCGVFEWEEGPWVHQRSNTSPYQSRRSSTYWSTFPWETSSFILHSCSNILFPLSVFLDLEGYSTVGSLMVSPSRWQVFPSHENFIHKIGKIPKNWS